MRLSNAARLGRIGLLALAVASLVVGVSGGLLRLGVALPAVTLAAALLHGALMTGGFFGTVIGIERAVAVGTPSAFAAPLASGLASLLLLAGWPAVGAWLLAAASAALVAVNLLIVRRQRAPHTILLAVASGAWLVGNLAFARGAPVGQVLPWWFDFLVLTIAAERLEMTRLMRRRPSAQPLLVLILVALLAGSALVAWQPRAGDIVYGAALVALSAWLAVFDIARRTVRADGLARYAAVCLLGGYAWLAVAGGAWLAVAALGWPLRDVALHALGLGFVVSMILGHAPIILPAIARVKLPFGNWFYVPLAALHASLVVRFLPALGLPASWPIGGALNAAALVLFMAAVAYSIRRGSRPARPRAAD